MDETTCLICGQLLSSRPTRIIKTECLKKCVTSSRRRKDGKHLEFRKYNSLEVHINCVTSYVAENSILSYQAKRLAEAKRTRPSLRTRSQGEVDFDFANLCIFCSEDASDAFIEKDSKKPPEKRNKVRIVTGNAFRESKLASSKDSTSKIGLQLYSRLLKTENLVAVGCRYHDKCNRLFYSRKNVPDKAVLTLEFKAVKFIANYIIEHEGECQFSIRSILANFKGDSWPTMKYLEKHLRDIFHDEIIVHYSRDDPTITYSAMGGKIPSKTCYKCRFPDVKLERKRVVTEAAKIIVEDIRLRLYDTKSYPSAVCSPDDVDSLVPDTLKLMLDTIISYKKSSVSNCSKQETAIAHVIISLTRPRSFVSPLLLGLASTLDERYEPEELLTILNCLGFCSSPEDVRLFDACRSEHLRDEFNDCFLQYVLMDNGDADDDEEIDIHPSKKIKEE